MLKAIILSKTRIDADTLGTVDVERLAAATEGYVARDLDMVVERALHAHITKKGKALCRVSSYIDLGALTISPGAWHALPAML